MSCTTRKSLAGSPSARAAGAVARNRAAASASVRASGTAVILPDAGRRWREARLHGALAEADHHLGGRERVRVGVQAGRREVRLADVSCPRIFDARRRRQPAAAILW